MSSPESSPSLFVQRLESSQVNLHYRLESSRISAQTRIESPVSNSHESTTRPGVPKLALQTWRSFFFWSSPDFRGKQQLCGREDHFFWSSPGFGEKIIRLSASDSSRDSSPSRNGQVPSRVSSH